MPVDAQAQQALVIQGGTLVDGNGGRTVANSFVVIQGNQIALDRLNNVLRKAELTATRTAPECDRPSR